MYQVIDPRDLLTIHRTFRSVYACQEAAHRIDNETILSTLESEYGWYTNLLRRISENNRRMVVPVDLSKEVWTIPIPAKYFTINDEVEGFVISTTLADREFRSVPIPNHPNPEQALIMLTRRGNTWYFIL